MRVEGHPYVAGAINDSGRSFTHRETGTQMLFTNEALMRMAREHRITSEPMFKALTDGVKKSVETDWDAFTIEQRLVAQRRRHFVKKIETLALGLRTKKKCIEKAIDEVCLEQEIPENLKPSVRSVRRWYQTFIASGRDIRALVDLSFNRGSRDSKLPMWMREEIDRAIFEIYATAPSGSLAATRERAVTLIRARASREGLTIPDRRARHVLGKNVIKRCLKDYENYDILKLQVGKAEADRIMSAVGVGPQGEYPLQQVEVDHTVLDVMVVDEASNQILGRPWLTALLDRHSRCIVGFTISFHPPSWTTVMEALRVAVSDKNPILAELGGIHQTWDCHGVPDELICDNGKDFHSSSMSETQAALGMNILYLPRKKGWLKGKIERFFGTLESQVFHTLPGTTFSNVVQRKDYDSEAFAVMTLRQVRWITTKWIVDVYHQTIHSTTQQTPSARWREGVCRHGEKLPPPPGLLVPLTGLVIRGKLSRDGVRYKGLRWNSNQLSALRNRAGTNPDVTIRIDTQNLRHAYVYEEDRRTWHEGDLVTTGVADDLTLHQYLVVRQRAKETCKENEHEAEALSRARGEIFDFVAAVKKQVKGSKADKRFARFAEDGRRPSEHIAPSIFDSTESAKPMGQHAVGAVAQPVSVVPASIERRHDTDQIATTPVATDDPADRLTVRYRKLRP